MKYPSWTSTANHKPPMSASIVAPSLVFTPLQALILKQMIGGKSQREIAVNLHMTYNAVHQQIEAARRRTGSSNTPQLVAVFVRMEIGGRQSRLTG